MTDDVNLAQPEAGANPGQPEPAASPEQPEEDPGPAQFDDDSSRLESAEDAGPGQAQAVSIDTAPSAAESEPVPDPAAERDEYRDLLQRKQAEFDNYKKRVERDRARANRQAEKALIVALLPLLDDFERALGAPVESGGAEAYRDGIELIHRQLLEILRKRGVVPIETAGVRFDPNLHEAVAYQTSEGHEDGDVIDELRRGYLFDEMLLRAAMVRVAKA